MGINSQLGNGLNCKTRACKTSRNKCRTDFRDLGLGREFLDLTPNPKTILWKKMINWTSGIKNVFSVKEDEKSNHRLGEYIYKPRT